MSKVTHSLRWLLFSCPVVSNSLWSHGLQHARPPCPSPCPEFTQVHVHFIGDAVQPTDPLSPFSPSALSFPASGTFPLSWLFTSDDQNTGASASASVFPVNIQSWSPLRLTGLISLLPKGTAGVFSSTTIWRHQCFGILPPPSHAWPLGRPDPWLHGPLLTE